MFLGFFLERSLSVTMQLAKILYLFLIGMSGLMLPILFCILATGGESDRDAVLFLDMVTLICFSVTFLLSAVYGDVLTADTHSRFAVACLLFLAVPVDKFSSSSVGVLILILSLCFAYSCSLTAIENRKSCLTSLLAESRSTLRPQVFMNPRTGVVTCRCVWSYLLIHFEEAWRVFSVLPSCASAIVCDLVSLFLLGGFARCCFEWF